MKPVQEDQVLKIIKGRKNSSATGVDYVDTRTIKLVAEPIAPVLTYIINLSSIFPSIWKWAKVIPLLKAMSNDPILPKSYCPVALLPILSKVLEKVVFSQLVEYLEQTNLYIPTYMGQELATTPLQLLYSCMTSGLRRWRK